MAVWLSVVAHVVTQFLCYCHQNFALIYCCAAQCNCMLILTYLVYVGQLSACRSPTLCIISNALVCTCVCVCLVSASQAVVFMCASSLLPFHTLMQLSMYVCVCAAYLQAFAIIFIYLLFCCTYLYSCFLVMPIFLLALLLLLSGGREYASSQLAT